MHYTDRAVTLDRNRRVSMAPIDVNGNDPGYISIDQRPVSQLTSVFGIGTSEGQENWSFYSGEDVRVKVSSIRCDCTELHGIGYHLAHLNLDIPDFVSVNVPLIRKEGNDYVGTDPTVAGARLNAYRVTQGGTRMDFDLSITLDKNPGGSIRIFYSGPIMLDN